MISRITIEEEGCEKILKHEQYSNVILKIIRSLGCENIGRGMNCAFAIGNF